MWLILTKIIVAWLCVTPDVNPFSLSDTYIYSIDVQSREKFYLHPKEYTVLLYDCLGTSSHIFGLVFVLEYISAKKKTQHQAMAITYYNNTTNRINPPGPTMVVTGSGFPFIFIHVARLLLLPVVVP